MKKLLFIALLSPLFTFGQTNLDSLWSIWQDQYQQDTTRLEAIHDFVGNGYLFSKPDSALYFSELEYEFAKSKKLQPQMANALNSMGISYSIKGDIEEAINNFEKSLALKEEIQDEKGMAASYSNLGIAYLQQGKVSLAIEYHTKNLKISEKLNNTNSVNIALNNIGIIYLELKEFDKALEYLNKSLELIGNNNPLGKIDVLMNIGIVYNEQKKYKEALDIFNDCLEALKQNNNQRSLGNCYSFLGETHLQLDNNNKSLNYYKKALEISCEMDSKDQIISNLTHLGNIYFNMEMLDSAEVYANESFDLAQKHGSFHHLEATASLNYEIYKFIGKMAEALEMHEVMILNRDSLRNTEVHREVIRQEYQYEFDKKKIASEKQQQINELNNKYRLWAILLIFILTLVLGGLLFIKKQASLRIAQDLLLQEIKLLKENELSKILLTGKKEADLKLNREALENHLKIKLNPTDWSILNILYQNPVTSNQELADQISLSIDGVGSSLKKMYSHFEIVDVKRSQKKLELIVIASRISNTSY